MTALDLDPKHAVAHARKYSWQSTTGQFLRNLFPNANPATSYKVNPESMHASH
jgi:hypothetical protein